MLIMHYYVYGSLIFTALIEALIKNIFVIAILKCYQILECIFEGAVLINTLDNQ